MEGLRITDRPVYYALIEPDIDTDNDVREARQQFALFLSPDERVAEIPGQVLLSTGEPLDAWRRRTGRA